MQLVGLVILLIVIIIASYFTTRYIGGKQLVQQKNSNFKVLDTYRLSQNKFLQLIKVGKKYIVVAVGKDFITEITELSEEEVLYHGPERSDKSFKEILAGFGRKKSNDLSDKMAVDELQKQEQAETNHLQENCLQSDVDKSGGKENEEL